MTAIERQRKLMGATRIKLYEGMRKAGKLESYTAQFKIVHKDKEGDNASE